MAIIKCPECGHPVSDKAPTCPTCGVEIVGKTITCANCGTTYFKDQALCPNCHCPNPLNAATSPLPSIQTATLSQESNSTQSTSEHESSTSEKKNNRFIWIISFVIALIICGTLYYFYHSASQQQEEEAYEYAMKSNDPDVLQSYLETYKDADQAHIDSIMSHLNMLKTLDTEWTNAIVSGSKEAIEAYLQKYPNSPYRQEAWNKIDSRFADCKEG